MKKTISHFIVTALALVLASCTNFFIRDTLATGNEPAAPFIGITPASDQIELRPGEKYTGSFRVLNYGESTFSFDISVSPYQVVGTKYDAAFDIANDHTQIAKWVSFSQTHGSVKPGEASNYIYYTVTVPMDVPAGGQYAAIKATAIDESQPENSGIKLQTSAAMVVYANVAGNTRVEATILKNDVPSFLFKSPITVSSLVENTGNTHIEAEYMLQVFPLFSSEEVYTNEEKPQKSVIMPESVRYNEQSWVGAPQLGVFKVKQTIKILDTESVTEKIVFICPMWFLLLFILFVLFCIYWVAGRSRARKKAAKRK